ncbi:MarR family transcriptional regulator [Geodermatophilus dictyosporus]|uniref:MarR family transcriptional regulator n=1 Tax=Geodermatophilus dictyosporus TaxID=1523247 RepID=UPI0010AA16B0|nr:MarR family transcriptional regulator [Geodermatophilus dictyosporus]
MLQSAVDGPVERTALHAALASFAGPAEVDGVVADLAGRGWLRTDGGPLSATDEGRAAHARLAAAVGAFRRAVADGLTEEEYARTVAGLARMVADLERALGR